MATETGRRTRTSSTSPASDVEEIVPNSGWINDHSAHFLLVDLPGFKKEEVALQVDASIGKIIVKGERQTNEQKRVHFELTFPVPPDSDIDNISGNFDSEILHVFIPKGKTSQEHKESDDETEKLASNGNDKRPQEIESEKEHEDREWGERRNGNDVQYMDDYSEKLKRKLEQKFSMSRAIVNVLMRNKGVVVTAVLAFSFGLYVSNKLHSWNTPYISQVP
ncbi:hypothetical protein VNO78_02902 [Psophocarpus tetragonolobus]|uniref:SHSP domain-containing protein n=1 Tax=Psophocarpus tetragonolobus TaxID=3891 RepID=A0AAN9T071_PSOTE